MTKEDLLSRLALDWEKYEAVEEILNMFFESNVCIPKGENRHPYADVLHEWIEDTTKKIQCKEYCHDDGKYHWATCDINYAVRNITTALRIKPKEPIYEWQWCVIMDNGTGSIYGYHTEESMKDIFKDKQKFKIEATKRERKQ